MIIDFEKLEEVTNDGFKGGEGIMYSRSFFDGHNRIMLARLEPKACSGYHTHVDNCEMIYVISGQLTCRDNDVTEVCTAGQLHYCPKGHSHSFVNNGTTTAEFLCVVPEQK